MAKLKTVKEVHGTVDGVGESTEQLRDFVSVLSDASALADYVEVKGSPEGRRLAIRLQESLLKLKRKYKVRFK